MNIRNFCIIAHIDHGKSTLADRMLEITKTVHKIDHHQMLDRLDIEQERGITIKLTPARMQWKGVELNLIDTPGHVDFQYEVSRSLAAVEGAILLVDASQGVQAQTLSVLYQAREQHLTLIPVLNKIDLPAANPERVGKELEKLLGISPDQIIKVSGKTGLNVDQVLDAIIQRIPSPTEFKEVYAHKLGTHPRHPTGRALIFDSVFDPYRGVVCYVKVVDGSFKLGDPVSLIHTHTHFPLTEVGYFTPEYHKDNTLSEGQIGYLVTGQKSVRDAQIGDTVVLGKRDESTPEYGIPGFKKVTPFVYAGVYPLETTDYDKLKDSFGKLQLNDAALEFELENSSALGFGLRCGFLGMLHMDIVKERLIREYDLETIFTTPSVMYLMRSKNFSLDVIKSGTNVTHLFESGLVRNVCEYLLDHDKNLQPGDEDLMTSIILSDLLDMKVYYDLAAAHQLRIRELLRPWIVVRSGSEMVDQGNIDLILEPFAEVEVVGPQEFSGNIMGLCEEYRGILMGMNAIDAERMLRKYQMPLGELIVDFYDRLKSTTKGYATMNYELKNYQESDLVKLDILLNGEVMESFSLIVHRDYAFQKGKTLCEKLKELIPKHLFPIPIQAAVGNKILARETISALKKDVIAKCYGGDISRKRKLLAKQKEGKKKLKAFGSVNVPGDIFVKMVTR